MVDVGDVAVDDVGHPGSCLTNEFDRTVMILFRMLVSVFVDEIAGTDCSSVEDVEVSNNCRLTRGRRAGPVRIWVAEG